MEEPDFDPFRPELETARVAILGLGLMGGSLALALRGRCAALLGADPDAETLRLASRRRVVDQAVSDPAVILPLADVVVLATPVREILSLIRDLPQLHPGRAFVLDLGSTKLEITRAMAALPDRFDPLGGHPMCGKETSGLANADGSLFAGAVFAFTALPRTSDRARGLAEQLAMAVGARPLWLDPGTHDRWTAATSHLPYLLAVCLSLGTPIEAAPLVGPGYRSAARLAASSPHMMRDVLVTNRLQVLEALKRLQAQLDQIESHLSRDARPALEAMLNGAQDRLRELDVETSQEDGF